MILVNIIVWSCFCISLNRAITNYGTCMSPANETGICVHITDCANLFKLLSDNPNETDRKLLSQSQCGYDNTQTMTARRVLVCCPDKACRDDTLDPKTHSLGNTLPEAGPCGSFLGNRILSGNKTQIDEFPWMALIEYKKPGNMRDHHCGGSLINSRYVLTAAHCIKGTQVPDTWEVSRVRLGEWDINTNPDCEVDVHGKKDCALPHVDINVEHIIVHLQYEPTSRDQLHDIALLRLAEKAVFNEFVKPICLPLARELRNRDFQGSIMEVAGWGATEKLLSSPVKLKIKVKIWPLNDCQETYRSFHHMLDESQLCAGGEDKIDTCQGDSGGPLMIMETLGNRAIFYLAGVVSFGPSPCGTKGWPGVYTNVGKYIEWIQNNLKP